MFLSVSLICRVLWRSLLHLIQFDIFTNDLDAGIGSVQSLFALNSVILKGSSSR